MIVVLYISPSILLQQYKSAEHRSFRNHYADLLETIKNPTPLSKRLYSAGLLSFETRKNIFDLILRRQKVTELLREIETRILLDSQNLYKFVEELEKDSSTSLKELCDKLKSTHGECVLSECVCTHALTKCIVIDVYSSTSISSLLN